jgi:membrane protein YdbS with pleckstrin-like domain
MRASPSYLRYRLFLWKLYAIAWGLAVVTASVAMLAIDWRLLFVVIPLLLIAAFKGATLYVVSRFDYDVRWYIITERSMLIRQGVWIVQEITLTFANAQNVRVTQGPLQRIFGFSNVEVDTAGGGGKQEEKGMGRHRAVLRGLENPMEVRDLILDLLRRHRTTGLGDPDDHHAHGTPAPTLDAMLVNQIWDEAKRLHGVVAAMK